MSDYQNPLEFIVFLAFIVIALVAFNELWQFWGKSRRKTGANRRIVDESGIVQSDRTASYFKGRKTPFIDKSDLKSLKSLDKENIKKINKKYKRKLEDSGKQESRLTYLALMPWRRFIRKEITGGNKITKFQNRSSDYNKIYTRKKPHGYEQLEKSSEMTSEDILNELQEFQNEESISEDKAVNSLKTIDCTECGIEIDIDSLDTPILICSCGNRIFLDDNRKKST